MSDDQLHEYLRWGIGGAGSLFVAFLGYVFVIRPERGLQVREVDRAQRDEDRTIRDRTEILDGEFQILVNLNSSQRNALAERMRAGESFENCRKDYRAVRESLSDAMTKLNQLCDEWAGASPQTRRRYLNEKVLPFLEATCDVLDIVRRIAGGLNEEAPVWKESDLKSLSDFGLGNVGLFRQWKMRKLFKRFYSVN